jgi:hypothetical protein
MSDQVLRDAVTAFEVYLEKSAAEVLYVHELQWNVRSGHLPRWETSASSTAPYSAMTDRDPKRQGAQTAGNVVTLLN